MFSRVIICVKELNLYELNLIKWILIYLKLTNFKVVEVQKSKSVLNIICFKSDDM